MQKTSSVFLRKGHGLEKKLLVIIKSRFSKVQKGKEKSFTFQKSLLRSCEKLYADFLVNYGLNANKEAYCILSKVEADTQFAP